MEVKLGKKTLKKNSYFKNEEILEFLEENENEERWSVEEQIEKPYILDRVVRTYNCKRMTGRWPVALFITRVSNRFK